MSHWFKAAVKSPPTMNAAEEDAHLQAVEEALLKLLNDDIEAADLILKQADSSYHHVGRGISGFIAAMLGAEKDLFKEAAAVLQLAENKTWEDMKTAQREPTAYQSAIYLPGTEYQLCYAVSQLTSAVTGVLGGSVTEAIKGFYKLRKAYLTLDGIMEVEKKFLNRAAGRHEAGDLTTLKSQEEKVPANTDTRMSKDSTHEKTYEAIHNPSGVPTNGSSAFQNLTPTTSALTATSRVRSNLLEQDPSALGITTHTDIFIYSGTRLCYGMLLVIFSMIENPIFTKILYIVGFEGDRERGTRYLWEATRFGSFNSAISGISLLGYYNGLVGVCDILPTDADANEDLQGYPKQRCEALLVDMRKRYPESKLWKLEEARMLGYNRNLQGAVDILLSNSDSKMKQIATIYMFETGLVTLCVHDYELCAKSWIQCAEFSSWSPTLYAYMTGIAYVELYRNLRDTDVEKAKIWKNKATEYIRKGPPLAGRQKVMSRVLPFDAFIVRKVKKWEERAKRWGCDLVDAIGVSPLSEQMYLWNGIKKQSVYELEKTLSLLQWERTSQAEKHKADLDEIALSAIIRACVQRNLSNFKECRKILTSEILNRDRHEFTGPLKDDWTLPTAHYEMAALEWKEKDLLGEDHKAKVLDCLQWAEKVQKWGEAYTLDTRMSFKITTSIITINRHRRIMGF